MDRTLIRPSRSKLNKKSGGLAGPSAALITRVIGKAEGNTLSPELSSPPLRGTLAKVKTAQHPTLWGPYSDLPRNHSTLQLQFATTNTTSFFPPTSSYYRSLTPSLPKQHLSDSENNTQGMHILRLLHDGETLSSAGCCC